jgi:6-pyruvoyl-tetrahydropterin synthase
VGELIWTRRYSFQSVHTLQSAKEERHGHQYFLEVSFSGREIDTADAVVENTILKRMHGRELLEFAHASGEYLVDGIHELLMKTELAPRIRAVALQETRKNRFLSKYSEARFV